MIGKLTAPWTKAAPLLLRVAVGWVFLYHGLDMLGIVGLNGFRDSINTAIGAAEHAGFRPPELWGYVLALTETIGGALILVGLFTRYASVLLAFVMGVAILKVHWVSGFRLPNGYEYAFTLFCCCLSLAITGGGSLSSDELLWPSDRKKGK